MKLKSKSELISSLKKELEEIDGKADRLEAALDERGDEIGDASGHFHQYLMIQQLDAMRKYATFLRLRLNDVQAQKSVVTETPVPETVDGPDEVGRCLVAVVTEKKKEKRRR